MMPFQIKTCYFRNDLGSLTLRIAMNENRTETPAKMPIFIGL
jgi:hypothetical protein